MRSCSGEVELGHGHRISYRRWMAHSSCPTIILLNGSAFNSRQWLVLGGALRHLTKGKFSVLQYDYGGIGRSTKPSPRWSIQEVADELSQVIDRLALGPCHLYGLSKGTLVALTTAIMHPMVVRSVGGYGWYNILSPRTPTLTELFKRRLLAFEQLQTVWDRPMGVHELRELWRTVYRQIVLGKEWRTLSFKEKGVDGALQILCYSLLTPTPIRTIYEWFRYATHEMQELVPWYQEHTATVKNIPFLLQHSQGDTTLPLVMAADLATRIPNAKLITYPPSYGHISPVLRVSQAHKIMQDYSKFLESCEYNT